MLMAAEAMKQGLEVLRPIITAKTTSPIELNAGVQDPDPTSDQ
jgi:methanogenic corrinoid protein MtbC1